MDLEMQGTCEAISNFTGPLHVFCKDHIYYHASVHTTDQNVSNVFQISEMECPVSPVPTIILFLKSNNSCNVAINSLNAVHMNSSLVREQL